MKDPTKTKKFYDPIYQVITIKPHEKDLPGGRRFFDVAMGVQDKHLVENIVVKVLRSVEMSRLNFLRQSGPAFLVFPSSSHSRFAHCLGTYHLGLEALSRTWVETPEPEGKLVSLRKWVRDLGLEEEFLLSLLLHDVGHFPFSHVLENNHELPFDLGSHEKVAADYIMGGDYSAAFAKYLQKEYGVEDFKSLSTVLDNLNKEMKNEPINKEAICFLICRDDKYLEGQGHASEIKMLAELTSGLLDLDRFDHYRRDAYFMGTNLARFNVLSFLDDVILTDDGIKLKGDGVSHALSLLQSQENIRKYNFEDAENLAYEAMLNHCVAQYFEELQNSNPREYERQSKEVVFWTDEELLKQIVSSDLPEIKSIIFRLRFREPHSLLEIYPCASDRIKNVELVLSLREQIIEQLGDGIRSEQLLFRMPRKYGQPPKIEGEWLSLTRLRDVEGNYLSELQGPVRREVEHLLDKQKSHQNRVWVFYDGLNRAQRRKVEDIITGRS